LPDYFTYSSPEISERIGEEMKEKMWEEEKRCQKFLDDSYAQARW